MTFGLAFLSTTAFAQDFYKELQLQQDELQQLTSKTAYDFATGKCTERYRKLFKDGTLNIVIGFGYSDAVPKDVVFDWYMVNGFKRVLTEPCRQGISACEFKISKNDPDTLFKNIEDQDGVSRRVEITLLRGSLSGNHSSNISAANIAKQRVLCENTKTRFYNEIKKGAEVVYYSGHSRDGGGPDFCPPHVRADGHVDYDWYQKNRPGLKLLSSALSSAAKPTQLLALHSCSSLPHFYGRLQKPGLAFFGYNKTVKMTPDFRNQYGGLDALLSLRCQLGLKQSMQEDIPTEILNFF